MRDPDHIVYFRGEGDALLVGGYIRDADVLLARRRRAPLAEPRTLFEPDLDRFAESWAGARRRVPALRDRASPGSCTARRRSRPTASSCSARPRCAGFWVAAGFCVHGLAAAGGVGKVMAEWIVDGQPEYDVPTWTSAASAPTRPAGAGPRAKALDAYSRYYDIVYPGQEWTAGPAAAPLGRPGRGCASWTRPSARRPAGSGRTGSRQRAPAATTALRPARLGRADLVARDRGRGAAPTTDAAGLFDQSSFAKLDVRGPGALRALQRLCANDVDRPVGSARLHLAAQRARRHRGRPDRDPRSARSISGSSPAPRAACATRPGSAATLPATARRVATTSPAPTAACACGGRRARDDPPAAHRRRPVRRASRSCARARSRSAPCRCWPSGSPSSASWAGSCTPDRVHADAVGHR